MNREGRRDRETWATERGSNSSLLIHKSLLLVCSKLYMLPGDRRRPQGHVAVALAKAGAPPRSVTAIEYPVGAFWYGKAVGREPGLPSAGELPRGPIAREKAASNAWGYEGVGTHPVRRGVGIPLAGRG
jgi:hypothetical protein